MSSSVIKKLRTYKKASVIYNCYKLLAILYLLKSIIISYEPDPDIRDKRQ